MKKMRTICAGVVASLSLSISLPAFGGGVDVENDKAAIVKVFGAPVGIHSFFYSGKCVISLPVGQCRVASGETLRVKVIGDKDILARCNGKKGITISRD